MLAVSNSLAKRPGQYGSTLTPAASMRVVILSDCSSKTGDSVQAWGPSEVRQQQCQGPGPEPFAAALTEMSWPSSCRIRAA